MNERTNERTDGRKDGRAGGRAGKRGREWERERERKKTNEQVREGRRECLTDFVNVWMSLSADIKLTSVSSNDVQILITVQLFKQTKMVKNMFWFESV